MQKMKCVWNGVFTLACYDTVRKLHGGEGRSQTQSFQNKKGL